jgi:hypothetical protein
MKYEPSINHDLMIIIINLKLKERHRLKLSFAILLVFLCKQIKRAQFLLTLYFLMIR